MKLGNSSTNLPEITMDTEKIVTEIVTEISIHKLNLRTKLYKKLWICPKMWTKSPKKGRNRKICKCHILSTKVEGLIPDWLGVKLSTSTNL